MIKPTIADLTKDEMNRYELVIAIAKCARRVTDEYMEQRERADRMIANRETDKPLTSLIGKEYRDEKAVKTAINRFYDGQYQVIPAEEVYAEEVEEA
jgi:DNA-directed RNA polymerase subunit K/omega